MQRKLVVDSCVFLTYSSHGKLYRLMNAVNRYSLMIYANKNLLDEIAKNISKVSKTKLPTNMGEFALVMDIVTIIDTISLFHRSPDPKDNFLFDLAIQTGSEAIITKEKALLEFAASPVPIHDIKWFKETFPVPL